MGVPGMDVASGTVGGCDLRRDRLLRGILGPPVRRASSSSSMFEVFCHSYAAGSAPGFQWDSKLATFRAIGRGCLNVVNADRPL